METLDLVGGRPCLDFTNTVSNYFAEARRDHLASYETLIEWARQAKMLDETEARHLAREAAKRPKDGERALAVAKELREAMFNVFYAIANGGKIATKDIAIINAALARALGKQHLVRDAQGQWSLDCVPPEGDLEAPLWAVVRSAAELLTHGEVHERIRVCGDAEHDCTWLFVDESKNGMRRWCTMKDCGNRAKARRHYERQKHA